MSEWKPFSGNNLKGEELPEAGKAYQVLFANGSKSKSTWLINGDKKSGPYWQGQDERLIVAYRLIDTEVSKEMMDDALKVDDGSQEKKTVDGGVVTYKPGAEFPEVRIDQEKEMLKQIKARKMPNYPDPRPLPKSRES